MRNGRMSEATDCGFFRLEVFEKTTFGNATRLAGHHKNAKYFQDDQKNRSSSGSISRMAPPAPRHKI